MFDIRDLYEYTNINNSYPKDNQLVYVLCYDYKKNNLLNIKCYYEKGLGWRVDDVDNKEFLLTNRPVNWKRIEC